jgi:hypothetical protein
MHRSTLTPVFRLRGRIAALLVVAVAACALSAAAVNAPSAHAEAVSYQSYVKSGDYRTLVKLWNTSATAGFTCPSGAKVRVIYGYGWFSFTRQNQTLDCQTFKTVSVGAWSKIGARIQIKVPQTGYVNWSYGFEG